MLAFLIVVALVSAVLVAGAVYQASGMAKDARQFPPPGRLIGAGSHRLHAHFSTGPSPTVVLEAGIGASSVSWAVVRQQLAGIACVCAYDRAGLGWSDAASSPRTLANILGDLHSITSDPEIGRPFVLVGHSFGGMIALEYACKHGDVLAGLVLVDPLTASEWHPLTPASNKMLARGVRLSRRGALLARLGVVRFTLALLTKGSRRIPKTFSRISSGNGAPLTERLVGEIQKLPPEVWPHIRAHWCQPKSFHSMADHLENLPANAAGCASQYDLGDLQLIVLSAADSPAARVAEHQRIAGYSRCGRWLMAEGSGHWIQLDRPDLVVSAIREVIGR